MDTEQIKQLIQDELRSTGGVVPKHIHNGIDAPLVFSNPPFTVVPDTAIITFPIDKGDIFTVTLGGNRTLKAQNAQAGDRFIIRLIQDGTGSRTVTWFSTIHWAGGSAPTLTTTAAHWDDLGFICTAANTFDGLVVGQNLS